MDTVLVAISIASLVVLAVLFRRVVDGAALVEKDLRIVKSALGDITGKQIELSAEYKKVHEILEQIRDLNSGELQDRKEILQHQNVTASNRVLQTRKFMAELEDAARTEMEKLRNG